MTTKPTGTRGYAYVRISDAGKQDNTTQRKALQKWLDARGLSVEWIEDSGSRDMAHKRQGFLHLLHLVENGLADWVVVAERDRFGAGDLWEYASYIHKLRTHGCQLWSAADDKELTGTTDRIEPFMATITSERSRSEQEARGQRAHRHHQANVQKGHWPGGRPVWGFDLLCLSEAGEERWRLIYEPGKDKRKRVHLDGTTERFDGPGNVPARNKGEYLTLAKSQDPVLLGWVEKIFQWFADGMTFRAIAGQLNSLNVPPLLKSFWVGMSIKHILSNASYVTGVPTWNKRAQGRFSELVNGELIPVARNGAGRVKTSRDRARTDHVSAPPQPKNAIIPLPLWNACQERLRQQAEAPKESRRARNPDLFLSGLVVCGGCGERSVGWSCQEGYRCGKYSHDSKLCHCNLARHDVLIEVIRQFLGEGEQSLSLLIDDPEHCMEVWELHQQSEPLISEYVRKVTAMWRQAKDSGKEPPAGPEGLKVWTYSKLKTLAKGGAKKQAETLQQAIGEKEKEKEKLARRMGLVDDDEAAEAIATRLREVTAELKGLREKAKPLTDEVETLRGQLRTILGQIQQTRELMRTCLPLRAGEAIRKVVARITVHHQRVGRSNKLRKVVIQPVVGASREFREEDWRWPTW